MISFDQLLEAAEAPEIRALDIGAFQPADVVNLILQRSEVLLDRPKPGRLTRAWVNGDDQPLRAVVDEMGDDIVRRAAGIIWLEYQELKPVLEDLSPKRVADIGCGYALFDLFLWQDFQSDLLLIDLEASDERHFGYDQTGAAYSSLAVAKRFLVDNGVPDGAVACRNPETSDVLAEPAVDLALSFISCGFHYPVATYRTFFAQSVTPGGGVILDLRARKATAGEAVLAEMGTITELGMAANGSARRVLMRRAV